MKLLSIAGLYDSSYIDSCDINNKKLQYLASALTEGSILRALDIGWNPYTSQGLTHFLMVLARKAGCTPILALSTNNVLNQKHKSLVEEFNLNRRKYSLLYCKNLGIGCKDNNWQSQADSMNYISLANMSVCVTGFQLNYSSRYIYNYNNTLLL